jgi:hypothetical protein
MQIKGPEFMEGEVSMRPFASVLYSGDITRKHHRMTENETVIAC